MKKQKNDKSVWKRWGKPKDLPPYKKQMAQNFKHQTHKRIHSKCRFCRVDYD